MSPAVSVIIPAYNHAAFVGEAIASVLNQERDDLELIVIDDGSTDATAEQIASFSDPRIRFFRQENQGAAATLNRGLKLAQGRWLAILNSDDRFHSERLLRLVEALERDPRARLAVSRVRVIDAEGRPQTADWLERGLAYYQQGGDLYAAVLRDNFVCSTSNLVFARELFDQIGDFLPLRYCHDLDFILQAFQFTKVQVVDEPLLDYRVHGSNTIREIDSEKEADFCFEVASVLGYALTMKGLADTEAPRFIKGLLETQFGAMLDLTGLLAGFPQLSRFGRDEFSRLVAAEDSFLRKSFLEFFREREEHRQHHWRLYHKARADYLDVLKCYEENQLLVTSLHQTIKTCGEELQALGTRVSQLDEMVYSRDHRISEQENRLAEQQRQLDYLQGILQEIYDSRG